MKTAYGMKKPKKVPSPTGRPSKRKAAAKAFDAGKPTAGKRPKPKPKPKTKKTSLSAFDAAKNIRKSARKGKALKK